MIVETRILARSVMVMVVILLSLPSLARAQFEQDPLKIFGFFQLNYSQIDGSQFSPNANSFNLQQLNIFLQRDLDRRLRAFVSLEFLNSFSGSEGWGSAGLSEAWLSFRKSRGLNLKAGLLLPKFNYLNDIKNKTPLLPYVIRPLVYESSFEEDIRLEEYVPQRAYLEIYGNQPVDAGKITYSTYLGNSPNINSDPGNGQTGIDTTDTFLIGGRIGLDYGLVSFGVSATYDRTNHLATVSEFEDVDSQLLREVPRARLGADLRLHFGRFSFESEWLQVNYDEDVSIDDLDFDFDLRFYYFTVFYEPSDNAKFFGGFWYNKEQSAEFYLPEGSEDLEDLTLGDFSAKIKVPNFGFAYTLAGKVTLKLHYARVIEDFRIKRVSEILQADVEFHYFAAGFSVFL